MVTCPSCGHSFPVNHYCSTCGEKLENNRAGKKCNHLYLNQLQSCPYCFTSINHFSSPRYVAYLMYFQSTLSIVFLLSSYFILQMILGFCFYLFLPELNQEDAIITDTVNLLIIIISNLIYILILTKYSPNKFNNRTPGGRNFAKLLFVIGLFILSLSFLELSLTLINHIFDQLSLPPSISSPYDEYFGNSINALIFSFLVILIGPVFEEIIFRKHICSFLESNISSKIFVIFLSGIIFSLNHLPADLLNGSFRFTIEHLYVVFILGLLLGVIYYKYGLLYSIIFHSLWNTFSFLTQIENILPDPVFLSNLLQFLGLIIVTILPGFILYKNREKVKNIQNLRRKFLSYRKVSLPIFTNTISIIIYEILVALLLVTNQNVISIILLLGLHTLGIILGFIVLDASLRLSNTSQ